VSDVDLRRPQSEAVQDDALKNDGGRAVCDGDHLDQISTAGGMRAQAAVIGAVGDPDLVRTQGGEVEQVHAMRGSGVQMLAVAS